MKMMKHNLLVILLMLVAFVGQAIASVTMSCVHESMTVDSAMLMQHDAMSVPAMANNIVQEQNQSTMMDCCQEQCQCPMSGCLSLFMHTNSSFPSAIITEQQITQLPSLAKSQVNPSLYRPPIS